MYKMQIWSDDYIIDTFKDINIEAVLLWYRMYWEHSGCIIRVYKNKRILSDDELIDLGF
jgi:hypothetical protein